MTQAEKDKIIKDLQDKLAEAEKIEVDEPKCWELNKNDIYWFVGDGSVWQSVWYNDKDDEWRYLTGNCFKTEEEAKEYKKQIEYTARYKNYIEKHSKPIDWGNGNQFKYCVRYCCGDCEIDIENLSCLKIQGTIYASSEKIIRDAIKEIGEDNFKKYVLGVK